AEDHAACVRAGVGIGGGPQLSDHGKAGDGRIVLGEERTETVVAVRNVRQPKGKQRLFSEDDLALCQPALCGEAVAAPLEGCYANRRRQQRPMPGGELRAST
ncbi:MAG: hypothetical protein ACPIOQ_60450, partial [Promethearchaeia archaeon]